MRACAARALDGRVVLVVTNNAGSGVLARAEAFGVPTRVVGGAGLTEPERDARMLGALESAGAEAVLLLGYLRRLGPGVLARYRGRIANTHPSLLPRHGGQGMYGDRVHAAVLAAGEPVSGVTLHEVDDDYDSGRIIAQRPLPVLADDDVTSLGARSRALEHAMLVEEIPGWLRRE